MTIAVIVLYVAAVLWVGLASHRLFRGTGEDFFVATRTIGPFVLLMSLFGTNMTAFSLLGASGEAYRNGIGVFGLMASSSAIVIPLVFFFLGTRMWALGKRHGFLTQIQLFRARWESDALGLMLFPVLVLLVVPYLLIGVKGGGLTLTAITGGMVPSWVGGLVLSAVVLIYVTYGGLRGTAWVNTLQTLVFMVLGAVALVWIVYRLGGLGSALDAVAASHPELMVRGERVRPLQHLSYLLIPLSAGMFPHLFQHWLSARHAASFKMPMIAYPVCVAAVWVPSVLLGLLGRASFPDLAGPEAGSVLIRMIHLHAPEVLAGLLAAGVLAAVMSSLDSQVLALGTMFTQDILRHHGLHDRMSERAQVKAGRAFVIAVLAVTYGLSLVVDSSIFSLAVWSFSGFAALIPVAVAAVSWRRSTALGAQAAVLTTAATWVFFFARGGRIPGYTVADSGVLPVAVMMLASSAAMVLGSLFGRPPSRSALERFFPASAAASGGPEA